MGYSIILVIILLSLPYQTLAYDNSGWYKTMEEMGEKDGKEIAREDTAYKPGLVEDDCRAKYHEVVEQLLKSSGFYEEDFIDYYVKGCVKGYNEAFGK